MWPLPIYIYIYVNIYTVHVYSSVCLCSKVPTMNQIQTIGPNSIYYWPPMSNYSSSLSSASLFAWHFLPQRLILMLIRVLMFISLLISSASRIEVMKACVNITQRPNCRGCSPFWLIGYKTPSKWNITGFKQFWKLSGCIALYPLCYRWRGDFFDVGHMEYKRKI